MQRYTEREHKGESRKVARRTSGMAEISDGNLILSLQELAVILAQLTINLNVLNALATDFVYSTLR